MAQLIRRVFVRRPVTVATPAPQGVPHRDPFADHPMWCKCYFHR